MASDPQAGTNDWYGRRKTLLIAMWWICWIGSSFLADWGSMYFQSYFDPRPLTVPANWMHDQLLGGMFVINVSSVLSMIANGLLSIIVFSVSRDQAAKARSMTGDG
jgi:hypothetical protein